MQGFARFVVAFLGGFGNCGWDIGKYMTNPVQRGGFGLSEEGSPRVW
jgi:hypothetical protein